MDGRTPLEKFLWDKIGEPLYYCKECKKYVQVKKDKDGVVTIKRFCDHADAEIMAPRKSILSGKGFAGLSAKNKAKFTFQKVASKITNRNV
jgi:hypothetical protein